MHLLQSGVPFNLIALWLGHESIATTHHCVEADLAMKEKALARLEAPAPKLYRFHASDQIKLAAQLNKLMTYATDRFSIVFAKGRNRLEVWRQAGSQPHQLNIALCFQLQAPQHFNTSFSAHDSTRAGHFIAREVLSRILRPVISAGCARPSRSSTVGATSASPQQVPSCASRMPRIRNGTG
jgi:hypothetical protein